MNDKNQGNPLTSWIVWSVVVVLVLLIVLLGVVAAPKKTLEAPKEKPAAVRTIVIEPREMADAIVLPGQVEAFSEAILGTEKGGLIVEINAEKGDRVEAGKVLMRLQDKMWKSYLKQAEVEKADADRDFARWVEMKKEGAVSDSDFDKVEQRKDMAQIRLHQAQINVSQCEVRSPVSGFIDERYVDRGEFAPEGGRTFRLVVHDKVKIVFEVPEQDVLWVKTGKALTFSVTSYPDQVFTGKVSFVAVSGSPESNTFRSEILMDNASHQLKPGMLAGVSLVRRMRQDVVIVPLATVIPQKGVHVVFVVEDGRAVRRIIKIDSIAAGDVVVASGIKSGETMVVEGHRTLRDGMAVDVKNQGKPGAAAPAEE